MVWENRAITNSFSCIVVYDITVRSTFTAISDFWAKEVEIYTTNPKCVKMLVGNKVDRVSSIFPICILLIS
jgi:GTPase SAR1 family protein